MAKLKWFLILFIFSALSVSAQTAVELETMLQTNVVTKAGASRFVLGAAELIWHELSGPEAEKTAYELALSRQWIKGKADDAIKLKELGFLVMSAFDLRGGFMYSLLRNPRYAYREMVYRRLIPGRTDASMIVSGPRLLQIIGGVLTYTGENERLDAELLYAGGVN